MKPAKKAQEDLLVEVMKEIKGLRAEMKQYQDGMMVELGRVAEKMDKRLK